MTAIDRAALIEASAAVLDGSYARWCDRVEAEQVVPETEHEAMAEAVLPVIARELLAPLRELHWKKTWHTPSAAGYECDACHKVYPCPTVRLLDQIEADCGGDDHDPNDQPTRVLPTEAEVAEALHADACPEDPDPGEACTCSDYRREAGIVLALFAEQPTVAQVKAEALREAADDLKVRGLTSEGFVSEYLLRRADRIERASDD